MAVRGGHFGAMEATEGGSGSVPAVLGREVLQVKVTNILNGNVKEFGLGERGARVIREGVALTGDGLVRRRMQIVTAPGQGSEFALAVVYTDHTPVNCLGKEGVYQDIMPNNSDLRLTFFPDLITIKRNN